MRNIATSKALWVGIAMLVMGFEIWFTSHFSLPLAFVWIVGPLLWYGGFMVICSVFVKKLFLGLSSPQPPSVVQPHASHHSAKAVNAALLILFGVLASNAAYAADAAATFKAKCAMCHGATGDGKTAMGAKLNIPDLKSKPVQSESDAQLTSAISKGKGKMPAFAGKLTAEETTAMVAYVRQMHGQ
jgi:cytochrome c6